MANSVSLLGRCDRALHVAGLSSGNILGQFDLALASIPEFVSGKPQLVSGLPQTPRKQSNESREERSYQPIVPVEKFGDLPYRDKRHFIAGALLLLGFVALLITLITGGDKKKESNDKRRSDN